jgi:uncharacterized protein (DUF433 family)
LNSPGSGGLNFRWGKALASADALEDEELIAGTRISLDSVVHAFCRGESPETICQNFELLRLEEVYDAIAYYLANRAEIDAYGLRSPHQEVYFGFTSRIRMKQRRLCEFQN